MSKKTDVKSAPSQVQKVSIPLPRDTGPINAADLLASLKGKKKTAGKTAQTDRPALSLTQTAMEAVRKWIPLNLLFNYFESKHKAAQTAMDEELKDLYYDAMWDAKSQPVNPKLLVSDEHGKPDMEAMLIVMEKFRVEMPEIVEDDDKDSVVYKMIEIFVRIGVNKDKASLLVKNEMLIEEWKSIPLTELMVGKKVGKDFVPPSAYGKSAAEKLILAIMTGSPLNLTEAEQEAMVVSTAFQVSVKGGFLNRVCSYCDTKEQLKAIMKLVVKPVLAHRGAKIGISNTLAERNARLIASAENVLGAIGRRR